MEPRLAFRITGRLLLAAVCAFAAHVAAYRTLWPQDGLHGYLGWYEPLVAGLSLAVTAGIAVFVVLARRARRRRGRAAPFAITALPQRPLGSRVVGIGVSGLVYLIVQESVEQSAASGSPHLASLAPGQWLAIFVAVAAAALSLACMLRLGEAVVGLMLGGTPVPAGRRCAPGWSVTVGEVRRGRPLALRSALRAPPVLPAA